jgi:TolB-like protein
MQLPTSKYLFGLVQKRSTVRKVLRVRFLAALLLTLFFVWGIDSTVRTAAAVEVTVEIQSTGANSNDAINNGLVQAIQQVTGVRINRSAIYELLQTDQSSGGGTIHKFDEKLQQNLKSDSNGVIKQYRIVSIDRRHQAEVQVQLVVTIEKYSEVGLSSESRRKIAVMPFSDPSGKVTQAGTTLQTSLISYIVKTRRFAVLDRSNSEAYFQEMSLITSGQTPLSEQARVAQVLSADYLVTGRLQAAQSTLSQQYIPLTGETVSRVTGAPGRVDFSLMEVATRQIKFTGNVEAIGSNDIIAEKIGSLIIEAIYPLRVIDASDPTELVINQGGDSVKVGQKFTAFLLGTEQFDPYTKESLGRREKEAAQIEVIRVLPKMSYAKVIKGNLPLSASVEIVLRKPIESPFPRASTPTRVTSPSQEPSILKLPFDR